MKIKTMSGRIHPLMAAAAVSVMLVSLIGVAAITGILPTSTANQAATPIVAPVAAPVAATNGQTALMAPVPGQSQALAPAAQQTPQMAQQVAPQRAPAHHTPHTAPHARSETSHSETAYSQQAAANVCSNCGRVESVNAIREAVKPSGVGVGVGAVLGGLLGNQVGNGNGRTLATVAGAVGGGYAGNEVERRTRSTTSYQVRVRMDDGETRSFPQQGADGWRVGDRVRIVNGELTSRN